MRKYTYEVINTVSRQDGKPLTRIYVFAKPRFSHREMMSKQERLLDRLTDVDCPLDCAFQLAVSKELTVASLCIAKIDHLDKVKKEIIFEFVHNLEIVVFAKLDVEKFINWLSSLWKGEWVKIK